MAQTFIVKSVDASTVGASLGLRVEDATQSLGSGAVQRILTPPYDPQRLVELFEHSSALNPAVTAIVANVHECGYRFEPVLDFSNANSAKQLRVAMMQERITKYRRERRVYTHKDVVPTDAEVELRRADIEMEMEIERCRLEAFFSACCPFSTFGSLRASICRDELVTGNAYVEIIRDESGEVSQLHWLKSAGMRLGFWTHTANGMVDVVEVEYPQRTTPITVETVNVQRPFRVFVQVGFSNTSFTHFKEFGDPRVVSSRTGRVCTDESPLATDEPEAHEVLWFMSPSQRIDTPYGTPVWIGAMPLVTGAMYAQLVNENHFNHKGIPQAFLFVDGADETAVNSLRENLRIQLQEIQDLSKYHALVIVGASSQSEDPNARVTFKVEPMRANIQDDALFQKYDAQCHKHIWMQFRIPPMLLGSAEDLNRATSDNVIRFAEGQVFGPMRQRFDDQINLLLLLGLGIRYMRFVSNSPVQRNPKDMSDMIEAAGKVGALSINQVLGLHSDQFNTNYNRIDEVWADMPIAIVKSRLTNDHDPSVAMDATTQPSEDGTSTTTKTPDKALNSEQEIAPSMRPNAQAMTDDERDAYVAELGEKTRLLREALAGSTWKSREIQTSKGLALILPYAEARLHASPP